MNPTIILGSSSPYRKALLQRLGLKFTTLSPDIDETPFRGEKIADYVLRMSQEKAKAIISNVDSDNTLVITSDQSATLLSSGDTSRVCSIIGKPHTFEKAIEQLKSFSGKTVVFYTSVTITCTKTQKQDSRLVKYSVRFKTLSEHEITQYVKIESPLDCAGSFKCEGLGVRMFDRMEGEDPTSLEGLPLIALCDLLCDFGSDPLEQNS